jgi:hypothetical protein
MRGLQAGVAGQAGKALREGSFVLKKLTQGFAD